MLDRRRFIQLGLCAATGCVRQAGRGRSAAPARCTEPTPEDLAGPFLPLRYQGDADLTRVQGRSDRAQGQHILIRGRVMDERCQPLPAARLEVWQANTFGRYVDERDRSGRRVDPGFQGSALVVADRGGAYSILTVKPGAYQTPGGTAMRAPHVHFRVSGAGCHDDIVQMYFARERLNASDENLALLSEAERRRVIVSPGDRAGDAVVHRFDVVLRRVDPRAAPGLDRFTGHYVIDNPEHPIPVTILVADGKLYADSPPLPRLEARPLSPTRFRLRALNVELEFDDDGFTVLEGANRTRAHKQR